MLLQTSLSASDAMLTPMSPEQVQAIVKKRGNPRALVFTEPHENAIRRFAGLPLRWLEQAKTPPAFESEARPGQFLVFQLCIYAVEDLGSLSINFKDLTGFSGTIEPTALRCISLAGTNYQGEPFTKSLNLKRGDLQPLWIGLNVPTDAQGTYSGTAQVSVSPGYEIPVALTFHVQGKALGDRGDSDARNLSRLRWLDSTVGSEATLTQPFTAVQTSGQTIRVLGRELVLGQDGLPAKITSFFSPANARVRDEGREVLAAPISFVLQSMAGPLPWTSKLSTIERCETEARWQSQGTGEGFRIEVNGRLDYTGSGEIRLRLTAERDLSVDDAFLDVPYREEAAKYFMGLNHQGGRRPERVAWRWDVTKRQDCFWLGDINAGLMLRFKDAEYLRPPVNIYYAFRPLRLPKSWGNEGKGTISIGPGEDGVRVRASSSAFQLRAGEFRDFIFELYLTPFRTLDTEKQWAIRFVHPQPGPSPTAMRRPLEQCDPVHGPNVLNVHHADHHNPYINYPYNNESFPEFCELVRLAHAKGIRLRVYYTTRELTKNMPEMLALHSLNGEVILPGPGKDARTLLHPKGPHSWLVENLIRDFVPAWVSEVGGRYAPLDLSVITTPDSRWNNFYLEGLQWLAEKSDFDGIYIDDTALDSTSLQRARRILDRRPGRIIDLHTWNHFNGHAGFANNLTIYTEVLPYLDRLWLGEGFNASEVSPEFWLVEMSGIPFGLMSEMLDGPNPWRGLLFGETGRMGWSTDPRALWKAWDELGIAGTEFLPFFASDCPVRTTESDVKATVFRKPGRSLIAVASWAKKPAEVQLEIDWKRLGLNPEHARINAPAITGFQEKAAWNPGASIRVEPGRGWLLVVDDARGE